jgi:hypothetical protein
MFTRLRSQMTWSFIVVAVIFAVVFIVAAVK